MGEKKKQREQQLGEIAEIQTGPFGSQLKNEEYIEGGTPVITVEHIRDHRITSFTYPSVTEEKKVALLKYTLSEGDIVFTRVGSVELSALVKNIHNGYLFSSRMLRVRPNSNVDSKYLSYFFRQEKFKKYLVSIAVGATMPSINTQLLSSVPVLLPPLPEQEAIAEVLSSLDDKIDLLHRQNKTLEEMAQALFRKWFVEEAEDEEKEIELGDVATNPRDNKNIESIIPEQKYVGLEHIDRKSITLKRNGCGEDVSSNKFGFLKNDILFGKLRPYFHKVCLAPFDGICSTDILVVRPTKPKYFGYCLFALNQPEVIEYANLGSEGTRMPRTSWKVLSKFKLKKPNNDLLGKFNAISLSMLEKILSNQSQIQTLTALRDTLLPKLMSGEVRVKEVEKALS